MPDIMIQKQPIQPGKNYIKVDKPGIKKTEGSSIVFKNVLPGNPEARLTFYKMDQKGGVVSTNFCQGQTTSYFVVPGTGNGEATCTLTKDPGAFAYSIVTVPATYEPLDPIIIIEPSRKIETTQTTYGKIQPLTAGIAGFLIGAAITYVLLKTVFAKNN